MSGAFARFHSRLVGFALLATCFLQGQVAETPAKRTFTYESDLETSSGWRYIPRWEGDVLVGYDNGHSSGPILFTVDRNGRRDETLFTIENGALIDLSDIAASRTGEIAIIGSAYTSDTRGTTFLARIAAGRNQQTITRVWPYCPMVLAFAADGTIWTIGHLKDNDNTREIADHVLRRFDPSGKVLGSTTLRVKKTTATDNVSYLRASGDRVGWLTTAGEYIEFSLDGKEIARYDGPEGILTSSSDWGDMSMALREDNEVVIGIFGRGKAEFVALDREHRSWMPISVAKEHAPKWAKVLGFDGATLVVTTTNGALRRFKTK